MMMARGFLWLALALMPLLSEALPVQAAVDMGGKESSSVFTDAEIDHLLSASGIADSIGAMPRLINEAIARAKPHMNDEERLRLSEKVNDSDVMEVMLNKVRGDVRNRIDSNSKKDIMAWFSSETGKKIILAERAVATTEGQKNLMDAVAKGASSAIDFDRSQILSELDDVTRASATQKLVLDDMIEILASVTKSQEALQEIKKSVLTAQSGLSSQTVFAMNFAFAGLKDDELRAYLDFYKTPSGQKWVDVLRGLTRAMWRSINQTSFGILQQEALQSAQAAAQKNATLPPEAAGIRP